MKIYFLYLAISQMMATLNTYESKKQTKMIELDSKVKINLDFLINSTETIEHL